MEKEKTCKNCGKVVDKKAVICTSCGVKIKKPIFKKWWFWVIVVIILVGIGASNNNTNTTNNTDSPTVENNIDVQKENNTEAPADVNKTTEAPKVEKNSPKISKEEFEALETGITYEEAVSIIGGEGELMSQVDVPGYNTIIYSWNGEGFIGANANATFQNNKLMAKAQVGLQ